MPSLYESIPSNNLIELAKEPGQDSELYRKILWICTLGTGDAKHYISIWAIKKLTTIYTLTTAPGAQTIGWCCKQINLFFDALNSLIIWVGTVGACSSTSCTARAPNIGIACPSGRSVRRGTVQIPG